MKFNLPKTLKYIGIAVFTLIVIITALILSLRLPTVQNFVKDKLVVYLENKIGTEVNLDKVYIGFPNRLTMENLHLQGQKEDTLFSVRALEVGLDMYQLMNNTADLTSIDVEGLRANVVRNADGNFNFDYIINAFASDEKEQKEEGKPFIISLNKINLEDIGVAFQDEQAGNNVNLYFKKFNTNVKTFDLEKNNYTIGNIIMDGLRLKLHQNLAQEIGDTVEKKVDSLSAQNPLKIALNKIKLTDFDVKYGDDNTKTFAEIKFDELKTEIERINLQQQNYAVKDISLKNADIQAELFLSNQNTEPKPNENEEQPISVSVGNLVLDNVKAKYNNTAEPKLQKGLDYNHLDFNKINLVLSDFEMKNGTFAGTIKQTQIQEKSGLNVEQLKTQFAYGKQEAYLKNLLLKTPKTEIKNHLNIKYKSVEQLSNQIGSVALEANLVNSKIAFSDLLILSPELKSVDVFKNYPNAVIHIDSRVSGILDDLQIRRFAFSGIDDTKIIANGNIKNATTPERLWFDFNINELSSSSKTIYNLVPKNTIPSDIQIPERISVKGKAKGTAQNFGTNLSIVTSLGNAIVNADVDMRKSNQEQYNIYAKTQNLNVGKLIKKPEIGAVNAEISAKGVGFSPEQMAANVQGKVQSAFFNNYNYKNISLKANLNKGNFLADVKSADPNLQLQLNATGRLTEQRNAVKLNGNITTADIHRLGFYNEPLAIAGEINADFQNLNPDELNGHLALNNFVMVDAERSYPISEIYLEAQNTAENNRLSLSSPIVDAEINGKYQLTKVADELLKTANHYYQFTDSKPQKTPTDTQYFTLNATLKDHDVIRKFVPELTSFQTIPVTGDYHSGNSTLNLNAKIPNVKYGENTIENALLNVTSSDNALNYKLSVANLQNESIALSKINVSGSVAENTINYEISSKNEDNENRFLIAGLLKSINDITEISLNENGLKLDYNAWNVNPQNKIQYSNKGLLIQDFDISYGESQLSLQSESATPNSPLNINIKDFRIAEITEMLKKEDLLADGIINGNAQIRDIQKQISYNADVKIDSLKVYNNPIGDLHLLAENPSAETINTTITLSGSENNASLKGDYNTSTKAINMNLNLAQLQMKTLEAFSQGHLKNTEGSLSGNLNIGGNLDSPEVLGKMKFDQAALQINQIGSSFRNINDEIAFTNKGVEFNQFKIYDPQGQVLTINGEVLTNHYKDFAFNLDIIGDDFNIVDSEKQSQQMLYGKLSVDTNLKIRGNLDLPKVRGNIAITENTDFTFVMPQTSPTLQDREGIVEFISEKELALKKNIKTEPTDTTAKITGMDVSVDISLNEDAKISVIVDEANGDFLKLQGDAELTGGIDPSGKITLVGNFMVHKGTYEMSVDLLRRKFDIQKGGTITWTGEPTQANVDITAVYKTNAAPIDLLQQQLSGVTGSELNQYKQTIPFNTLLKINGELLKPTISFDITLNDNNPAVPTSIITNTQTKLTQLRAEESEMNKQVFALLLLNRFIGDNPFQSQTGMSAESMARQSVSRILSEQLNNLAGNLIAGVDLNFDLQSTDDYSTGEHQNRTDLNVQLSKQLLNDRLKVSIGSNFGLEGEQRQNEQMTNIAGDISLDYALSQDGRYMLRAYRKNEYQVALQGQVIETGVGFIITMDYNRFREIFQKNKKQDNAQQK